jgi:hypothetical protein
LVDIVEPDISQTVDAIRQQFADHRYSSSMMILRQFQ